GIQAIDLVTRKLPLSGGAAVRRYIGELKDIAERSRMENRPDFGRMGARLAASLDDLDFATEHLLNLLASGKQAEALAGATPYLRLFGTAAGGTYLAKGALASRADQGAVAARRVGIARFFAEQLAPATAALRVAVTEGAEAVLDVEPALLAS
ncbi:MAG TPA: acyl-CoA dehydrogenase C-terminal domain-containing protein, partial [Propylenella sp.]|nr:acyl-CoA dehydrogenase C-terminal domain-containing protein [Propylenella sp.]